MPALPAGSLPGHAGLVRHLEPGVARVAVDRRRRAGRRRRRSTGRSVGRDRTPLAAALPATSRRHAPPGGADAARPLRQEAARRNGAAVQPGGDGGGVRKPPPIQRPHPPDLFANTHGAQAVGTPKGVPYVAGAPGRPLRHRVVSFSPGLPPALRLGCDARLSRRPRDAGCRIGRRPLVSQDHHRRWQARIDFRRAFGVWPGPRARRPLSRSPQPPLHRRTRPPDVRPRRRPGRDCRSPRRGSAPARAVAPTPGHSNTGRVGRLRIVGARDSRAADLRPRRDHDRRTGGRACLARRSKPEPD